MNSSNTAPFPTAIPVAQIRHLLQNCKRLLHLVLGLLGLQASAQNLIVNGDFESGPLAPWNGGELWANPSGGLCARIGDLSVGDAMSQTIPTADGKRYLLSADLRSDDQSISTLTITAQAQTGDIVGSRVAGMQGGAFQRFTLVFTATGTTTSIDLRGTVGDYVLIDNVSLTAIPPSSADQSYTGMMVTTVTVTEPPMSTKSSRKVTARISAAGDMICSTALKGSSPAPFSLPARSR